MYRYKNLAIGLSVLLGALIGMTGPVIAQAVTRAYQTDAVLQRGMIVRIDDKNKAKVQALTVDKDSLMEGIVVAANDAPVTLSEENQTQQQVFVATTGKYNVLVSNQNGIIKTGDFVTISSLAGIGMAAGNKKSLVVGKALAGFDGKTSVSGSSKLKGPDGRDLTVNLGLIPVDINISRNPHEARKQTTIVPGLGFLQTGANVIASKTVDPVRLYVGCLLLLLTTAISGSILYADVRTAIISIGRNPLAKKSIIRGLIQVVLVSVIILIIGLFGVYLLIKL